jgi:hypothetical protein
MYHAPPRPRDERSPRSQPQLPTRRKCTNHAKKWRWRRSESSQTTRRRSARQGVASVATLRPSATVCATSLTGALARPGTAEIRPPLEPGPADSVPAAPTARNPLCHRLFHHRPAAERTVGLRAVRRRVANAITGCDPQVAGMGVARSLVERSTLRRPCASASHFSLTG